MYVLSYREVMSHPVITLHKHEQVSRIIEVLRLYPHEGFPVVDCREHNDVGTSLYAHYCSHRYIICAKKMNVVYS